MSASFDEAIACADAMGPLGHLRTLAGRALADAQRESILPIPLWDGAYPPLLSAIADPPPVLWVRGDPAALVELCVGVVGSRYPSAYGLEAATSLAGDLARSGATVVSGLARGVDSAAHQAALDAGGRTVAVLGCGVNMVYPREHDRLQEAIASQGAVVSELIPGTPPLAFHFPARNRIISGLSLALVVVEAAEHSGSLITAALALEQGREVMAVPGSVFSGRHRGCHALIKDGAAVVESAEDVVAVLASSPLRLVAAPAPAAGGRDDPILGVMVPGEAVNLDVLAGLTGLPTPSLLSRLLHLELQGQLRRLDGGQFVRLGRTC